MSNLGQHDGDGIRYAMHLSAPKGGTAQMLRDPAGGWVSWADYARLKAECQARQAENSVLAVECDSLKAEVERLTKAGDFMYDRLCWLDNSDNAINARLKWREAKGVQS